MLPNQPTPGESPTDTRDRRPRLIWFLLLAFAAAWLLGPLFFDGENRAHLTYTDFLDQVRAGNVESVTIQGSDITGRFAEPTGWPPDEEEAATFEMFAAVFPEAVGDPELLPLLQSSDIEVDVKSTETPFFLSLLANLLPWLLIIGAFIWIMRRASSARRGIFGFGRSKARRFHKQQADVTFEDVAGQDQAKRELEQVVGFLRTPDRYHEIGARLPRGVLLVGPPGTGKTLLARAVAGEANVPFFNLSATEFVEMFVGVGASRVRDLFEKAKSDAPAIVFIDELDAVGRRRGAGVGNTNDEREQTLNQLLAEMDGFDERENIIVLAATNRPDVLDPALQRPGRFDRQVVVPLPDRTGRRGILEIHTRELSLGDDVDLDSLAAATMGMSGADLANLANEAALIAAGDERGEVTSDDFDQALDKVILGGSRKIPMEDDQRRAIATHEAGHALVAWLTPGADPVRKVTIVPHGRALGATTQLPDEDRVNYSRGYLAGRLAVLLGGRAAEEIRLREITTGAEADLVEATRLARRMVARWGMGSLGPIAFRTDDENPFLGYELARHREVSPETASRIDADVERIIESAHAEATKLLEAREEDLNRVVDTLIEEETLDGDHLEHLIGSPGS